MGAEVKIKTAWYECRHCGKYHKLGTFHITGALAATFEQVELLHPEGWTMTAHPLMEGDRWYPRDEDDDEWDLRQAQGDAKMHPPPCPKAAIDNGENRMDASNIIAGLKALRSLERGRLSQITERTDMPAAERRQWGASYRDNIKVLDAAIERIGGTK